ncbi:MAG: hypothetical protein ACI4MM_09710 [Candidatus Ventricola sp.]
MKGSVKCWALLLAAALLLTAAGALAQTIPEDGCYTVGVTSNASMFRVVRCVLDVKNGELHAVLTLSGQGYGYLYPGTAEEAAAAPRETWVPYGEDSEGRHTFAMPISALDKELAVAAYSIKYDRWYDRTLVFQSDTLLPYNAPEEEPGQEEAADVVAPDGVYAVSVTTDSGLLRFSGCVLTVRDGRMTAVLTAQKNSFAYLYAGLAKDARADEAGWIAAVPDAQGAFTYVMEVPSLDQPLSVATYSEKTKLWYDRTITLDSATLAPL